MPNISRWILYPVILVFGAVAIIVVMVLGISRGEIPYGDTKISRKERPLEFWTFVICAAVVASLQLRAAFWPMISL